MTKAVFAGSFDPFTMGHWSIVRKAARMFDEVIVLFAVNDQKHRMFNQEQMMRAVRETVARFHLTNVTVDSDDGLVVSYCERNRVNYLVRGIRNSKDFLYEEDIATANALLNEDIETVYLRASDDGISSSLVRACLANKREVFPYVTLEVYNLIKSSY